MSDCVHTKVGLKIRKVITIAAIISLSFLINFFGVPFFWIIAETERIEFGLVVGFALIGIVQLSWLMLVVLFLPLLDQLIHSHFLIAMPLEMIFNLAILIWIALIWNIFIKKNQQNNWMTWLFFALLSLGGILICKLVYLQILIFIINPEITIYEISPTFFVTIFKFSVILFFANIIKINIKSEKLIQI